MAEPRVLLRIERAACSGAWNMAADEALLEAALRDGHCSVRVYGWDTATVSLGYFQDAGEFTTGSPLKHLPAVRRLSGGGAILHDREITYSVTVPPRHLLSHEPARLYRIVHDALIGVLGEAGIESVFRDASSAAGRSPVARDEPFLCFLRGDPNDLIVRGRKIVGSAQRRRRGAILQHGSLILDTSPYAPEIPGLSELVPDRALPDGLPEQIGTAIAARLAAVSEFAPADTGETHVTERLTDWPSGLVDRIRELVEVRYNRLDWRSNEAMLEG